ncbi:MAG: DUF4249 family protein [Phycisphaerales bacterium]|nr:DUF4249 family protein [Phycisphaerales bacterium]
MIKYPFLCLVIVATTYSLLLVSCQKVINLKFQNGETQYVVEGQITDSVPPYQVRITRSVPFTDNNIFPPVTNAFVVITDNTGVVDTLRQSVDTPGVYFTQKIKGMVGNTYNLKIEVDNNTFTAQSTMPQKVKMDSITTLYIPAFKNYFVWPSFTNPADRIAYYRFDVFVNNAQQTNFFTGDNQSAKGLVYSTPLFGLDSTIKSGDTLTIIMYNVQEDIYNYFVALGLNKNGNNIPANPVSNITGNVSNIVGYFSANTIQTVGKRVR